MNVNQGVGNGAKPAFPIATIRIEDLPEDVQSELRLCYGGIDVRTYLTAAALTGLLASPLENWLAIGKDAKRRGEERTAESFAREAVEQADAVIKELNKPHGD